MEMKTAKPHNMPSAVVDDDFKTAITNLIGLEIDKIQDLAMAMRSSLCTDAEILAYVYLKSIPALQRSMNQVRQMCGLLDAESTVLDPNTVFGFAARLRPLVSDEMSKQCALYAMHYAGMAPPRFSGQTYATVALRAGGIYSLTSDARNTGPVMVNDSPLLPGESIEVSGSVTVASTEPQLLVWSRIGGAVRVGDMCGILPLPKKVFEMPVAIVAPVKSKSWFSRKQSNE
jgi:hypothetical protein